MKKVYVATSWRNEHQPEVVRALRAEGFDVYDFRHPAEGDNGFSWREIDGDWLTWTPEQYLKALTHPASERGFTFDMDALRSCDFCVMVMPCGMSASLETGYAVGAGKPTAVYVPGLREPDLMVKMAGLVTADIHELRAWLRQQASEFIECQGTYGGWVGCGLPHGHAGECGPSKETDRRASSMNVGA